MKSPQERHLEFYKTTLHNLFDKKTPRGEKSQTTKGAAAKTPFNFSKFSKTPNVSLKI
jgi:hypothetical protein